VPHVASALKSHVAHRPPAARPSQAPDRASSTPFASLLDDNAAAPERTPPSAADNHGPRAARSDQPPQPAKNTDSKAVDAGKTDKTDEAGQIAGDGQAAFDAKPADAKIGKLTVNNVTPVDDKKPADTPIVVNAATEPRTNPLPTITPAAAIVTTLPSAAGNAATTATQAMTDTLAAPQAGQDQADNGAPLMAKAAPQPLGETKPQGPAVDAADKDAIAHARDEAPHGEHANTAHHTTPAQANAALAADTVTATPKAGNDVAPPIVHSAPLSTPEPAAPAPAASAPLPQPVAIAFAGVAVEIAGKALAGKNHFEIRLDPPELGRIEVRLDVDRDGNVISRMIADRADTLDLLRRDASGLERALQDAGLKTSDNGLQFSLRDQSTQQQADRAGDSARLMVEDDMLPADDAAPRHYGRLAGLGSGVDIHV
jgi:flagellar hook-length control protein FliK